MMTKHADKKREQMIMFCMDDMVPHFSTFGKNYTHRFKDTDLFEQLFAKYWKTV